MSTYTTLLLLCSLFISGVAILAMIAVHVLDKYLPTDSDRAQRDVEELIREANKPKRRAF